MADLLIRNVPPEVHSRLKASAKSNRRSLTQEAIAILDERLKATPLSPPLLPEPIKPSRPITMQETIGYIDDGQR